MFPLLIARSNWIGEFDTDRIIHKVVRGPEGYWAHLARLWRVLAQEVLFRSSPRGSPRVSGVFFKKGRTPCNPATSIP